MPEVCFKCHKANGVVLNRDGSLLKQYCPDCFTQFMTRSIRDQLFSQCSLPCDLPVAVAVSGGPHSMMLLHQLGLLRAQNAVRQGAGFVRFVLLPFHLCEDALVVPPSQTPETPLSSPARVVVDSVRQTLTDQCDALRTLVTTQPPTWEWASVPLFTEAEVRVFHYSDVLDPAALALLRAFLHHPKLTLTTREELYESVKRSVMQRLAAQLCHAWYDSQPATPSAPSLPTRWTHLVSGESAVRSAVLALQSIVSGEAGDGVVHKAGARALGTHGVVRLRPLRSVLPREAVVYGRLHGIKSSYTPSLSTCNSLRSVHRTLESFVLHLHVHYRTALFNVLTMTNKLESADANVEAVVTGDLSALNVPVEDEGRQPEVDPPLKKPRTDDCVATREATAEEAQVVPPRKDAKAKGPLKAVGGRTAQRYRDLCLQQPPVPTCSTLASRENTLCPSVRVCLLCGSPSDGAQVQSTEVMPASQPATVCRRCEAELHQLRAAADHAGTTAQPVCTGDSGGDATSDVAQFEQLMALLEALSESEPAPQRLVKGALSEADRAAYLLPEDD